MPFPKSGSSFAGLRARPEGREASQSGAEGEVVMVWTEENVGRTGEETGLK